MPEQTLGKILILFYVITFYCPPTFPKLGIVLKSFRIKSVVYFRSRIALGGITPELASTSLESSKL